MGIQHSELLAYVVDAASHGLEGMKQFIQNKRVTHDIWRQGIGHSPSLRGMRGKDIVGASLLGTIWQAIALEWPRIHHVSLLRSLHSKIRWKADLPPLHKRVISNILRESRCAAHGAGANL